MLRLGKKALYVFESTSLLVDQIRFPYWKFRKRSQEEKSEIFSGGENRREIGSWEDKNEQNHGESDR